ncbi:hypothetical protein JCM17846_07100 [Iodidimonas nitroreducens]|uniref:Uncharacterized protein n=1 Tax=Iodidimonas nitroreducens TaxID=1236968 RepID=A0A5A7N4G5_9PROT|nr:protein phosphatase CheZ [Iodidimonas nitroreducens]GAK32871.1 chemotaxis regulator CheZ [alpha proteobacterium Q-1]GER03028.1 hypothetical protein JCM17846_07100 [Iodidimonas nitroreducens]
MTKAVALSIEDRLNAIKASKGEAVTVDEIGSVVANLLTSLDGQGMETKADVGSEVRELLDFIAHARDELAFMRPKTLTDKHIVTARDELDAVVAHTEEAAGKIMDAADKMGELAGEVTGEHGDRLFELSTEIFEASSFQDITGQRVSKVVSVLRHIEDRLSALAEAIGDTTIHEDEEENIFNEKGEVVNEDALKHGPQLDGKGNNQDDIDALLASFD